MEPGYDFCSKGCKVMGPHYGIRKNRNSRKQKTTMRIGRSTSINGRRRFGTLTWMYERPPQRYQGCAPIQYRKNFLLLKPQPNGTQKNSRTGSRDVTLSRILHQSEAHLTSFTEFDIVSVRMLANI